MSIRDRTFYDLWQIADNKRKHKYKTKPSTCIKYKTECDSSTSSTKAVPRIVYWVIDYIINRKETALINRLKLKHTCVIKNISVGGDHRIFPFYCKILFIIRLFVSQTASTHFYLCHIKKSHMQFIWERKTKVNNGLFKFVNKNKSASGRSRHIWKLLYTVEKHTFSNWKWRD